MKKVITNNVKVNFVALAEAREDLSGKMKYSVMASIRKDDKAGLAILKEAIQEIKKEEENKTFKGCNLKDVKVNIKQRHDEYDDIDYYSFNASTLEQYPPKIVDKFNRVMDASEIKNGDIVRLIIVLKPYKFLDRTGISFYLNGVQKVEDRKSGNGEDVAFTAVEEEEKETAGYEEGDEVDIPF